MPRRTSRSTGRWVERAASTGGGRTYRGQAPVRWYASLVLICLLGIALFVYSRYERDHPSSSTSTVGTTWYTALAFDVCGKLQPDLASSPTTKALPQIVTEGDGVLRTASTTKRSDATLGNFVDGYRGLRVSSSSLKLPSEKAYVSGGKCPSDTPDAGRRAYVQVRMWSSFFGASSTHPVSVSDPSTLSLANGQEITVAYVPKGASIPKPSGQTVTTLVNLFSGVSSTTTTTPSATTTTPPAGSTTTTGASASTTLPST